MLRIKEPWTMEEGITINKSVLILNLLWFVNLASMDANANTPIIPRPDPWFVFNMTFDASSFPEGINLAEDGLGLINNTDIPFYIVSELEDPLEWLGVLPDNVMPKKKLVSDKYYLHFTRGKWRVSRYKGTHAINLVELLSSHGIEALQGQKGAGRPEDVQLPKPVNLEFSGYYGSQKIVINGTLSYKLNERYDPEGGAAFHHWFDYAGLDIKPFSMPQGLSIVEFDYRHSQHFDKQIRNTSSTPFYTVYVFDEPIDWYGNFPNNIWPQYKLVSGKSYYSVDNPGVERRKYTFLAKQKYGWLLNSVNYQINKKGIHISSGKYGNKNIREDCRPEKVEIPGPEPTELITYYGKNRHVVEGKIHYVLNPDYDPIASQAPVTCGSCTGAQCQRCAEMNREAEELRKKMVNNCKLDGTKTGATIADIFSIPIPSSGRECEDRLAGYGKRAKAICYDFVNSGLRGPLMVVVPTGDEFNSNFAIGKYEISVGDYSKYCTFSKSCTQEKNKEKVNNPITGISLDEAKAYAAWLSERTGKTYRLPTTSEWEYSANAGGNQPKKDYNCRVVDDDKVIKGDEVVSIKSGKSNAWGLKNYIGNVQEWVTDGDKVMVRGGAYTDPHDECDISLSRPHSGEADDITGFRLLLEMDVNYTSMNLPGINLSPQIFAAVQKNDLNMAKLLIQRGADLNIKDGRLGRTPLHYAQSKEMVDLLIKANIDINVQDRTGRTPLYFMIENYDADNPELNNIIKLLLENGANSNIKNSLNDTPIFLATRLDKVDIMELLAKSGADLNIENKGNLTPIFIAKSSEAIEVLSKYGADLNYHRGNKRTVLYQSLRKNDPNIELIKTLLDSGADPNIHPENNSPLNSAVYMGNEELIKALINHGVDPNTKDKSGKPILSKYLHHNKNLDSAETLLKYGANPNYLVIGKHTALSWALVFKWDEQAELLIKYGADVNANLDFDRKPLHIAIGGSTKIVKLLIDAGAKVNAVDNHNKTPLRLLCELGLGPKANPNMPQLTFEKLNNDNKNRIDNFKLLMKYDRSLKSIMGCKDKWDGIISYWDYIFSTRPFIMVPTKKYCGLSPIISDQKQDFIN